MYSIYESSDIEKAEEEFEKFFEKNPELNKVIMFWKNYVLVDNFKFFTLVYWNEIIGSFFVELVNKFSKLEETGLIKLKAFKSNISKSYDRNAYLLTVNLKKKKKDFFMIGVYSKLPYSCCNKQMFYINYIKKPLKSKDSPIITQTSKMVVGVNKNMEPKKIIENNPILYKAVSTNGKASWFIPDEFLSSSAGFLVLLKDYLNNYRIETMIEYITKPPFDNVHPYLTLNKMLLNVYDYMTPRLYVNENKEYPIKLSIRMGRKKQALEFGINNISVTEHDLRNIDKPKLFNEIVYATRPFIYKVIVSKNVVEYNRVFMKNIKYEDFWSYPHEIVVKPLEDLFKFTLLYSSFTSYYGLLTGNIIDYYEKLFDVASDFKILSLTGKNDGKRHYFPLVTSFRLLKNDNYYYIMNLPNIFTLLAYLTEIMDVNLTHVKGHSESFKVPIIDGGRVYSVDLRSECGVNSDEFIETSLKLGGNSNLDEYYIYNIKGSGDEAGISVAGRKIVNDVRSVCDAVKYLPIPALFIRMDDSFLGVGQLFHKKGEAGKGVFILTSDEKKHLITSVDSELFSIGKYTSSRKHGKSIRRLLSLF